MNFTRISNARSTTAALVSIVVVALAGCSETTNKGADGGTTTSDFESDSPFAREGTTNSNRGGTGGSAGAGGSYPGAEVAVGPDGSEAAAVVEAQDIVQVRGSTLYSLSRHGGFAVIDISKKDQLALLGQKRVSGEPLEMYLRDDVAYAVFSSWSVYESAAGSDFPTRRIASHIEAIDISDPGNLHTIGSIDVPGDIVDTSIVDDVLYAVTHENGSCWKCADGHATTITSLSLTNPNSLSITDKLSFPEQNAHGTFEHRSVTLGDKRMYVAGKESGSSTAPPVATIQVVDLAAGTGKLTKGALLQAKSSIESRWQMNEYDGTLRVISSEWYTVGQPTMQTYKVTSSSEVTPLASVDIVMPKSTQRLRTVHFDGARGYAIAEGDNSTLITFDFSDPKQPKQAGALEIQGWGSQLDARGDRLFAVGYDSAPPYGSPHVSMFDVADVAKPTQLSRIPVGGPGCVFTGRRQRAFDILPADGLIIVPYREYELENGSCGVTKHRVRLVDFTKDALKKRGVASQPSDIRRAFSSNGALLTVSDDAVTTQDITNRDAPTQTVARHLANDVGSTMSAGSHIARWSSRDEGLFQFDVAPASDPETLTPKGAFEQPRPCGPGGWTGNVDHHQLGDNLFEVWRMTSPSPTVRIFSMSIADPLHPTMLADTTYVLPAPLMQISDESLGDRRNSALFDVGREVIQMGATLVYQRQTTARVNGRSTVIDNGLEVFDLSDPGAPKHASSVNLPLGQGTTALSAYGNVVYTSHWVIQPDGNAKFYVDRVDLSNPWKPETRSMWNIPGSLVGFDPASNQVLSVAYETETTPAKGTGGATYCDAEYPSPGIPFGGAATPDNEPAWGGANGSPCVVTHRSFKLVQIDANDQGKVLDTMPFPTSGFLTANPAYAYFEDARLVALARSRLNGEHIITLGIGGPKLTMAEPAGPKSPGRELGMFAAAAGRRAVLVSAANELRLVDATDVTTPVVSAIGAFETRLFSARIDGDSVVCALGPYGVTVLPLKK